MKERGVAFTRTIVDPSDIQQGTKGILSALFPETTLKGVAKKALPIGQEFLPFKAGKAVGRAIEEQARVLDFVVNLRDTGDITLAAQRTKQFLFDYGNLTNFEKTFMRRLIPFYTFTRKNLELQVKTLLTTPGRVAAEVTTLSTLGEVMAGGKLSPEEEAALPDWIKVGIGILSKKKGETVEILGSLGTPIEQPF